MPVKGTKVLEATKASTVISDYTTGAPVAPEAGHLSVYVDLAAADQHRDLEVIERLFDLINRAREENYQRAAGSEVGYYYMPLIGSRAAITFTLTAGDIVEGMVAVGISGEARAGSRGSLLFDTCWKEIIDWLSEKDRITV